ncbi:transcriptional regulator [Solitalea longa]|uniref:Transcriptional regulator n=1 Tax=Solitalea longa TaxID=2079460 RepID=A0A2S5A210_9SPHI|nr:transcriptional regulator [Solitalea longa]POY36638.1 transcriptional regulator [Solitalea longa]
METVKIDTDIKVMYVTAKSFPDGVLEAHQSLHSKISFTTQRKYFGISRPENNHGIVYRAAAEELKTGEAEEWGYETLTLKKGNYISQTINDYMKDLESIGRTFQELLQHPNIDPEGYCVELYLSDKDVQCMVRLAE